MKVLTNKFNLTSILVILAILSSLMLPTINGLETFSPNNVLSFLEDVAQLDMKHYESTLIGTMMSYPPELAGIPQMSGKYFLESETSKLDVLFKFRNNSLSWCLLRVIEGSPLFSQQTFAGDLNKVENFIQRYQTYSKDSNLVEMKNLLSTITINENITKIRENVKINVISKADSSSFSWRLSFNGADYSGLDVRYNNGLFCEFRDDRSYYRIGNTNVNINEAEAIEIALSRAKDFSWMIAGENITDFNIVEESISAELLTKTRDPLELNPYWLVILPLDDLYPGFVSSILVTIWADTAEVIDCHTLTFGGELPYDASIKYLISEDNSSTHPTDTSQTAELSPASPIVFVILIILLVILVVNKRGVIIKKIIQKASNNHYLWTKKSLNWVIIIIRK